MGICVYSNLHYLLRNETKSLVWRTFVVGASTNPGGLYLVSDVPSACSSGSVWTGGFAYPVTHETTPEQVRAKCIFSRLLKGWKIVMLAIRFQNPNHKAKVSGCPRVLLLPCAELAPSALVHLWVSDLSPAQCWLCGSWWWWERHNDEIKLITGCWCCT